MAARPSYWCPQGDSNPCSQQPAGDANASLRPLSANLGTPVAEVATALRNGSAPLRGNRPHFNRSALMLAFNAALRLARQGSLDRGRVNRGFALAQSSRPLPYGATTYTCGCKDFQTRKVNCKHQIAASLREQAGWKLVLVAA